MIYHKLENTSKLLQNLQVLWQYLRILHLQVNTFFKYWVNTHEYYHNTYKYCHNTCKYWAGEYLPSLCFNESKTWKFQKSGQSQFCKIATIQGKKINLQFKHSSTIVRTIKMFFGRNVARMLVNLLHRNDIWANWTDQVVPRSWDTDKLFGIVVISFGHSMHVFDMSFQVTHFFEQLRTITA